MNIDTIPGCWGKLRRAGSNPKDRSQPIVAWHPLNDHCADVAACLVALLGLRADGFTPSTLNQRLARLGGQETMSEIQVARLGVLTGLHDIGKCNHGFQAKAGDDEKRWAGHVAEVVPLITIAGRRGDLQNKFLFALQFETLTSWATEPEAIEALLLASVSHHGKPAEEAKDGFNALHWTPKNGRDPLDAISDLAHAVRVWLPQAWSESQPLPSAPAFAHAFAGLVQLADWLGSDDSVFRYRDNPDQVRWPFSLTKAAETITNIGLNAAIARAALVDEPFFADFNPPNRLPRPMQSAVAALSLPSTAGSVTLIEDETGAGKTEAAILHFLRLFRAGLVDGMYLALPTRTAATQIFARVNVALRQIFPADKRPVCILAVPGYLRGDEVTGQRSLVRFEVLWPDHGGDRHRFWAAEHPKRYLAGTIVVGTIDQVLLSALKVGHSHLRAACLLRHLLVVDEVHASDTYMSALLSEVLGRHRKAGGHALLLSATLGAEAAGPLLGTPVPAFAEASLIDYPRLSVAGCAPLAVPTGARKAPISLTLAPSISDPDWIASAACDAARKGARVLVIRNTVSGCLAVQEAIERIAEPALLWCVAGIPTTHHARFTRDDRELLDHAIEHSFGGNAVRNGGVICCATQTVQQSLDLDADLLITDICPMDVLLQRIGRLHRHAKNDRPVGFTEPSCVIVVPDQGPAELLGANGKSRVRDGLGTVYPDCATIAATWETLLHRACISIPQDNRLLVESATHHEALHRWRHLDDRWEKHQSQQLGVSVQHRQQAKNSRSRWDVPFDDPLARFPSGDLDIRITTRLGEGDRRIEVDPPVRSPFGGWIRVFTIPAWLLRNVAPDVEPVLTSTAGGVLLTYPDRVFMYDRLGLRLKRADPEDDHADA